MTHNSKALHQEQKYNNLKKSHYHTDKITEITRNAEVNIRKIILEEVRMELSNLMN